MYNPIRRNQKLGQTQGGRVTDGRAREKWSRVFSREPWRKLADPEAGLRLVQENPSRGYFHPCGAEEYAQVLAQLPPELSAGVKAVVLHRTPKVDEALGVEARLRYGCVVLNAFPVSRRMWWGAKAPDAAAVRHYQPWCTRWEEVDRRWALAWTDEELRRYYRYHLFLHEVGHLHQPHVHATKRREGFAEEFALQWARRLGVLP